MKGSDEWQFVPELNRDESEPLVHKTFADSFEDTDLEDVLADAGIGRLVFVSGAQTDECIRSTIHGAMVRGYDVTLVGDAHTTEDLSEYGAPTPDKVIAHTNLYWQTTVPRAAPPRSKRPPRSPSPTDGASDSAPVRHPCQSYRSG